MIITFKNGGKQYQADLSKPIDLAIAINPGEGNPNCYWAEPVKFETIVMDGFTGSVAAGGPVNYQKLSITPHGNGTHTECYGHITADEKATITHTLKEAHFVCKLLSLRPENIDGDSVITYEDFISCWEGEQVEAVVIRTLPNDKSKLTRKYSGTNPTYLDHRIAEFLNAHHVKHLITDLPSVDREEDGGKLRAHRAFWGVPDKLRKDATITELAYIDNAVQDGLFLLNLQTINIDADASPSRPVIYEIAGI